MFLSPIDVSLPLSLPSPLSKKSVSMSSSEDKKKNWQPYRLLIKWVGAACPNMGYVASQIQKGPQALDPFFVIVTQKQLMAI